MYRIAEARVECDGVEPAETVVSAWSSLETVAESLYSGIKGEEFPEHFGELWKPVDFSLMNRNGFV